MADRFEPIMGLQQGSEEYEIMRAVQRAHADNQRLRLANANNPGAIAELDRRDAALQQQWDSLLQRPAVANLLRAQQENTARANESQALTERIRQFVASLSGTPDANDPVVRGIASSGVDYAQGLMQQSGMSGGGISRVAELARMKMMSPYLQQRAQLAMQGMGLLNNRELGIEEMRMKADELNANRDAMRYGANQNMGAGAGSGIGTVVGGGLTALALTNPVTAPLAPFIMPATAAFGSGVGGMTAGSPTVRKYNSPYGSGGY